MKKGKGSLSVGLMMEAWREDGATIGRLKAANRYLAERLAGMGLHPEDDVEAEAVEPAEREALAKAWMQAAEVDAALTMEQGRVRA